MQRFAFVLLLVLACFGGWAGAFAGDDIYSVSNVPVDATADSATLAQTMAINSGRSRAWAILYRRLTKNQDWARQPVLDDVTLQRLVRNYVPANERRSTTRFVANMTYVFNPDAVRHLLRSQNIAYVDMEARPVLLIAMAPGYSPRSAWEAVWTNPKYARGDPPIVTPLNDPLDNQSLAPLNFQTAQWQDVEPAASRAHATDAFLVQAIPARGSVTVAIRRLGPGGSPVIPNVVVNAKSGQPPAQLLAAAADAAAAEIADVWKSRSAIDFGKRAKLVASVRFASPGEWGGILQRLATLPTVTDVNVVAIDSGEARLALTYAGTAEQLQDMASAAGLSLQNGDGGWQLATGVPTTISAPAEQ